ncbi:MAG: hypothetical protein CMJ78_24720 [Planctomycetaceae bacterium]|nr:hypothetical protein [Planctomycetaceae bacterium]
MKLFGIISLTVIAHVEFAVAACPFCGPVGLTLGEKFTQADSVVLATWQKADTKDETSTFQVVQIARDSLASLKKNGELTVGQYRQGKAGDLFLLTGSGDEIIKWDRPIEITEIGYYYVAQAPSREALPQKRLSYYLRFLQTRDDTIANDAFAEFAKAPYEHLLLIQDQLKRERIRGWLESKSTPVNRVGLYALMLGLCGNSEDAEWMKKEIQKRPEGDFRFGLDGMIAGYLLQTGIKGLDWVDETILTAKRIPDGEAYEAMKAFEFLWTFNRKQFGAERLKKSLRLNLDRVSLGELVIRDLARWKDWEVRERVFKLYGKKGYEYPRARQAIIGYLVACANDDDDSANVPEHVLAAHGYLGEIKKQDPKNYRRYARGLEPK